MMLAIAYTIRAAMAAALCFATAGCMGVLLAPHAIVDPIVRFHNTVEFTVIDAETGRPLPGATVTVAYAGWGGMVPDPVAGVTDQTGRVALRVVKNENAGAGAAAAGYLPSIDGELGADPPPSLTLRAFREPPPFHVLEVPAQYRGELRFRVPPAPLQRADPRDRPGWQPGQRAFVTRLVPGHVADMRRLPYMGTHVYDHEAIREARSEYGAPVPMWFNRQFHSSPPPGDGVALWCLGFYSHPIEVPGTLYVMYMGTLQEAAAAQAHLRKQWEATLHPGLYLLQPLPDGSGRISAPPPG